ncbi:MAG: 50S ribosomal protein L15, partial [Gemmatimonadales bacterium]
MAEKITLSNLRPAAGSAPASKRVGRGPGSGLGKTSGKGHKGHKARTGGATNPGFEGGQMPIYRRLPKRGFTNPFKVIVQPVNLSQLKRVSTTDVSPETLYSAGLIAKVDAPVKLLGTGDPDRAYT